MKYIEVEVSIWEVGDYVRTPDGVGIVVNVSLDFGEDCVFLSQYVDVQHKHGNENNTGNIPKEMEGDVPHLITKEEYDNEVE